MKIYLAAPFDHIEICRTVQKRLQRAGHEVTSRWLELTGEPIEKHEVLAGLRTHPDLACNEARADLEDIESSDLLILWTDVNGSSGSWGGRHVEYGFALGLGKRIAIVGEPENLFHVLPSVMHFANLPDMLDAMDSQAFA